MKTIVHIDSDPQQQAMLRLLFESNPVQVICFSDYESAKEYLDSAKDIKLVVTEISENREARDNYLDPFLKKLHEQGRFLIVLTEFRDADAIEHYQKKGIDGWFTKPVSRDNFYMTALALMNLMPTT